MPALILAVCSSWQLSVLLQSEIETKIKRGSSEITLFFFFFYCPVKLTLGTIW